MLEEILSRVKPKDLISLSQTCRLLNIDVLNNDKLWTEVCYNEYKIIIPSGKGFARKFFKHSNNLKYIYIIKDIYYIFPPFSLQFCVHMANILVFGQKKLIKVPRIVIMAVCSKYWYTINSIIIFFFTVY